MSDYEITKEIQKIMMKQMNALRLFVLFLAMFVIATTMMGLSYVRKNTEFNIQVQERLNQE